MSNTASQAQIQFINSLKEQFDPSNEQAAQALDLGRALWQAGAFDKPAASAVIDALKAAPRLAPQQATETPEGMHKFDGAIYKVQKAVHGSGNLYAKVLVRETHEGRCAGHMEQGPSGFDAPLEYCEDQATCTQWVDGETTVTFEYAPGAIRNLSEDTRLSLDEAKEFGTLYGTCIVCGRTLTNEESIKAGIGPVCSGRF